MDALCVQAEVLYNELDPALRETMTVGRPVAET
jgi:hypothetical protein